MRDIHPNGQPRNLLLGQNVTSRHPGRGLLMAALAFSVPAVLFLGAFALGTRFPASHSPSWPPAHLRLVPPIPQPQETVAAYIPTNLDWLVRVVWEPVRVGRFLGAEPVKDADVCTVHVAAEVPYSSQLTALQEGTARCFAETFTKETASNDD